MVGRVEKEFSLRSSFQSSCFFVFRLFFFIFADSHHENLSHVSRASAMFHSRELTRLSL